MTDSTKTHPALKSYGYYSIPLIEVYRTPYRTDQLYLPFSDRLRRPHLLWNSGSCTSNNLAVIMISVSHSGKEGKIHQEAVLDTPRYHGKML